MPEAKLDPHGSASKPAGQPMTSQVSRTPWTIPSLRDLLRTALAGPLPRAAGQGRMAPRPRTGWTPDVLPEHCRDAAALLLLYPKDARPYILLTLRTNHLPTHQGQVSLPGGGVRTGESIVSAALREGREEVGIEPDDVEILGTLSPLHIPVSGFILHPCVAVAAHRPELRPHEGEVAQALEVPLTVLCDPARVRIETRVQAAQSYQIPYFLAAGEKVWGATAMVLSEFLCVIGCPPSPQPAGGRPASKRDAV